MDNSSEQIPSMSQEIDNLSKLADERIKNMDNFNQTLINVAKNEIKLSHDDNNNFVNERVNQDSSAMTFPREEEIVKRSRNHSQHINEVTKFDDNQSTVSILENQKFSEDMVYEQIEPIITSPQITNNNENVENDFTYNNSVFYKPNTLNNNNSENVEVRNDNDLILSYIEMETQQGDKESTNNELNNDNNNNDKHKEIMELKIKIKQEYGRITLALKDQLTLYNKFREVIPEYIRKPVENKVGFINFTFNQPEDQTDGVEITNDPTMGDKFISQESESEFLSSTESSSSEQNKERGKKSTKSMNGYNYFVKKQFKKSKNESRKARDIISSSAKKWLDLPASIKKHYQSRAKLRRENVTMKQNRLQGRKRQPRQPRIDTPGENESEILAVVIPIHS
ncbi:hypothetical protein RclHR1_11080007 [Rhizophagus clarus]|uniref:Uncharacterized protein n=1 Tax=Rhizophagus clarus TaxID=94130 RepID=A0A2Z6Q7Y8_9GLOM|nr:hypothetical protein RclHR1_11080007 [Rhizophagus clarus]GES96722.1 hypothetical protein GLOIN_2v1686808 [Rhizophagus clarus]